MSSALTKSHNVLIVEDSDTLALLAIRSLQWLGLEPERAADGEAAIHLIESQKPDLLLLDLHLPDISGWDILEYTKYLYGEHNFICIIMTSHDDSVNRSVGRLQYVYDYLIKPVMPDDLMNIVSQALSLDAVSLG